jgi:DNA-binding CsgD family transcriptional regulator
MRDQIEKFSPAGFYVALRVGFSFPEEELNHLPENWVEYYTIRGLVVHDPVMKWVYGNLGVSRMTEISLPDPYQIRAKAMAFGLNYGAVISVMTPADRGRRSYGLFFRDDRDFLDLDLSSLHAIVKQLHGGNADEPNLTAAEIEALRMQASGLRLKQVAGLLGISESAVKARLNNAKRKLGAKTLTQASSIASSRRLI